LEDYQLDELNERVLNESRRSAKIGFVVSVLGAAAASYILQKATLKLDAPNVAHWIGWASYPIFLFALWMHLEI